MRGAIGEPAAGEVVTLVCASTAAGCADPNAEFLGWSRSTPFWPWVYEVLGWRREGSAWPHFSVTVAGCGSP